MKDADAQMKNADLGRTEIGVGPYAPGSSDGAYGSDGRTSPISAGSRGQ